MASEVKRCDCEHRGHVTYPRIALAFVVALIVVATVADLRAERVYEQVCLVAHPCGYGCVWVDSTATWDHPDHPGECSERADVDSIPADSVTAFEWPEPEPIRIVCECDSVMVERIVRRVIAAWMNTPIKEIDTWR